MSKETKTIGNFLSELKALLKKYDATIEADVGEGSDTHGIYGEHILVCIPGKKPRKVSDYWGLDHTDIK